MTKNFSDLPPAAQVAIPVALPALLAFAVFWFYVSPMSRKRSELEAGVKSLHEQNLKGKAFEQQRAQYVSRIAVLRTELEAARSAVPDEENTGGLVNLINDTGVQTGVHVRSLAADPLVERDLYTEAPFKLRVDGTYYAIVEFFDRLMRGQRLLSVSNLALGSPARGSLGSYTVSPNETVGANCLVTSYFNSAPAATPAKKAGH
jgi:type IV pilus assembly protein PilO